MHGSARADHTVKKQSMTHRHPSKAQLAVRKKREQGIKADRHEVRSAKRKWHDFNKYTEERV